ncbi:TMEM14 family protein [Planctomycetes bacterium K23_9]
MDRCTNPLPVFCQTFAIQKEKTHMDLPAIITGIFGAFVVFGGIMGYVKAASKASLIAGGITGGLLILSAFLITTDFLAGKILAIIVSLVLLSQFAPSLLKKFKVMPNLLIVVLGVLTIAIIAISF